MAYKIATFSLDPDTIARLEKLCSWLRINNKSKVVAYLIDREFNNQKCLRESTEELNQ